MKKTLGGSIFCDGARGDVPGGRLEAESELEGRRKRREGLEIRPLTPSALDQYAAQWRDAQSRFVDSPQRAVTEADALVGRVMSDRGYPMEDFEVRAADISVDHPEVVENYRRGHEIAERNLRRSASTEELRQAMVHYRALFDELLSDHAGSAKEDL